MASLFLPPTIWFQILESNSSADASLYLLSNHLSILYSLQVSLWALACSALHLGTYTCCTSFYTSLMWPSPLSPALVASGLLYPVDIALFSFSLLFPYLLDKYQPELSDLFTVTPKAAAMCQWALITRIRDIFLLWFGMFFPVKNFPFDLGMSQIEILVTMILYPPQLS